MSYYFVVCDCAACGKTITPNPNHCPSLVINTQREPICPDCFNMWNQMHRIDKGLDPKLLHPLAYEPEPETEI